MSDSCPNCGYCKHCGRSNYGYSPHYTPWWSTPITITNTKLDPNTVSIMPNWKNLQDVRAFQSLQNQPQCSVSY